MRTRRLFQVASAMFSAIFAVTFLVIAILTIIPLSKGSEGSGIIANFCQGTETIVGNSDMLPNDSLGCTVYVLLSQIAPALLLLLGAFILFTKPTKSQGKYLFADLLSVLGMLLFTVLFEINAKTFFGDDVGVAWMIGAGAAAFLLTFLVVVSLLGGSHKKKPAAEKSTASTSKEPAVKEQPAAKSPEAVPEKPKTISEQKVKVDENVPDEDWYAEPEKKEEKPAPVREDVNVAEAAAAAAAKAEQAILSQTVDLNKVYIPEDCNSVSSIMEHAYGGEKVETISSANMKKIKTLRSMYESHAISTEEYLARMAEYLDGDGSDSGDK